MMGHIGRPVLALLVFVRRFGKIKSGPYPGQVGCGVVFLDDSLEMGVFLRQFIH
jgi:hypothetical protein